MLTTYLTIFIDFFSWLNRQFMHFDANFRLTLNKRMNRAEGSTSLWAGTGFFVNTAEYQQYLSMAVVPKREGSPIILVTSHSNSE